MRVQADPPRIGSCPIHLRSCAVLPRVCRFFSDVHHITVRHRQKFQPVRPDRYPAPGMGVGGTYIPMDRPSRKPADGTRRIRRLLDAHRHEGPAEDCRKRAMRSVLRIGTMEPRGASARSRCRTPPGNGTGTLPHPAPSRAPAPAPHTARPGDLHSELGPAGRQPSTGPHACRVLPWSSTHRPRSRGPTDT